MQDLIKRYFWVVGALVVATCAVFAAKATGHVLEAKFLGDPAEKPKVDRPPPMTPTPTPAKPTRTKDGTQLSQRNMFCSECTPAEVVPTTPTDGSVVTTSLPLVLLATNVAPFAKDSYATIINTESQRQGAYAVGEKVPGASGAVIAIRYKYVDFVNNGHTERVVLQGATAPIAAPAVADHTAPPGDGDELTAMVDAGIKKIDDTTYEIDKSLVDKVLLNPMAIAKGARVVPAMKNGKPEGFKLYAIKPSSAFAKLGLTNGDTLTSVNGFELTSADKALEVYTKLQSASNLELEVQRRGKPMTLKYTIR